MAPGMVKGGTPVAGASEWLLDVCTLILKTHLTLNDRGRSLESAQVKLLKMVPVFCFLMYVTEKRLE